MNKNIIKIIKLSLPFIIGFLFVILPLIFSNHDMWDGVIIDYASLTNNFTGVKNWFYESGWIFQYWQTYYTYKIAIFFSLSYKSINLIIIFLSLYIIIFESFIIARDKMQLSESWAIFAASLTAIFPMWNLLLSSVLTYHFMCLAFGILGIRLIHHKKKYINIFGIIFTIIGLGFNAMLTLLPILSFFYDSCKKDNVKRWYKFFPSLRTIGVFISGVIVFLILNKYYHSNGLYSKYNSIINPFNLKELLSFFTSLLNYSSFLILPFLAIIALYILSKNNANSTIASFENKQLNNHIYFTFFLVIFFSIFPYCAVGKYTHLLGIYSWDGRQALPLGPLYSSFILVLIKFTQTKTKIESKLKNKYTIVILSLIFLFQLSLLIWGFSEKFNRQVFSQQIIKIIKENESKLLPGKIQIIGSGIPELKYNVYESNYIFYLATGKALWWTKISNSVDKNFKIPDYIIKNKVYRQKYIYKKNKLKYSTIIHIEAKGFNGFLKNQLLNTFKIGNPTISIKKIITSSIQQ